MSSSIAVQSASQSVGTPWGDDAEQRAHLNTSLTGLLLYAACALLQTAEVWMGLIDAQDSWRLAFVYLLGGAGFVALIRSGWNRRFQSDPALLQAQCLFAVAATCGSYSVHGPMRGAVISLVALILVFGMFHFSARQSVRVSAISLLLLGSVIGWKAHSDPANFPMREELIHFFVAALILSAIAVLSVRLAGLRQRLSEKNVALSAALEQIRRLATKDELTGLFNRRHMAELLHAEHARQRRADHATSLTLIDIDFFKRVNDEHGHAAGDAVLKAFAVAAGECLRSTDVLARWGGEEFLLLLPDTNVAEAQVCVQRIRERVNALSFAHIHASLKVTFSAGLTSCSASDVAAQALERADQAMYQAKRAGRNCTVLG
jgi:diguanylate cyclase